MKHMKHIVALILVVTLAMAALPGLAGEMEGRQLQYFSSSQYWSGGKLCVEGSFFNLSSDCDVVGLVDGEIDLVDAHTGEVVCTVRLNSSYVANMVVSHNGTAAYNFTTTSVPTSYGASSVVPKYRGTFYYEAHQGKGCPYCRDQTGSDSSSTDAYDYSYDCGNCLGSGKCEDCGGERYVYRKKYGLFGSTYEAKERCQLCEGSGDCYKCGGDGRLGD